MSTSSGSGEVGGGDAARRRPQPLILNFVWDRRFAPPWTWPVFSRISLMSSSISALPTASWNWSAFPRARPEGALVPSSSHFDMFCRRNLRR